MGCDKALLAVGGGNLLDHMSGILRAAGADPVLIGGRPGGLA
ncbi:MAG: molybdenum cofactor guanylyltransferase, partial [Alphaproteobacteria bacterium]